MKTRKSPSVVFILLAAVLLFAGQMFICSSAHASCVVTNKQGEVKFSCVGDKSICKATYAGYTLTCDGTARALPALPDE